MTPRTRLGLLLAAVLSVGGVVWAALQLAAPTTDLAAFVPQGALLTIEAKDFSALLNDWTSSPEASAWLKSDNYAAFSRSHLFSRLQDAQKEFATAAGVPVDNHFLSSVAGHESFFAWYDIGNLQVVYVTKLSAGSTEQNLLLSHRKEFSTRQSGGITFYVKTSDSDGASTDQTENSKLKTENSSTQTNNANTSDTDSADTEGTDASDTATETSPTATTRTVAFAISGDWLILATDEDLMAQTLELMAAKDHTPDNALSKQPWYIDAKAKAAQPGDLRMVLNLKDIVPDPAFRSYWVQQNITDMKHYTAAVCDLTRNATGLHEDRVLLPAAETEPTPNADLDSLAALIPDHTAIFRATAAPTEAAAVTALQEKVLTHGIGTYVDPRFAPQADLSTPQAGNAADYETRIDEPIVTASKPEGDANLLHAALHGGTLQAMMTVDRSQTQPSVFVAFASAVVLQSSQDWDATTMREALRRRIAPSLTTGSLGTDWQPHHQQGLDYFTTSDAHGLAIAFRGHLCLIADDPTLLLDLLQSRKPLPAKPQPATILSTFDHQAAAGPFTQWTTLVDGIHPAATTSTDGVTPPFFAKNLTSLSHSFAALQSETFTQRQDGPILRQTVDYKLH